MPPRAKSSVKRDRVSVFAEWLADQPLLTELTLTALTVLFGMQVLRALIPGMVWVFGSQMGWNAPELGLIGLLVVLIAFLSGPLGRLMGNLRLVAISAAGLALVRFVIQVWWSQPLFNLILAIIGTIFFVIFLPAYFENARRRGGRAISRYALGILGGIALDVAINGAAGTYDTIWQLQPLPLLLTLLLVIIQLLLLLGITPTKKASPPESRGDKASGISTGWSFTWLAIGPFLFLELVIFQNIPRLATLTGWPLPMTFGFTLISQLAGLAAAAWILARPRQNLWPWALVYGVLFIASVALSHQETSALVALLFIVGQVLLSSLTVMMLKSITAGTEKTDRSSVWIANGVAIAIFLALLFVYSGVIQANLPNSNAILEPVAGGIVAVCAIVASFGIRRQPQVNPKLWPVPIIALIFLLLPIGQIVAWRTPTPMTGQGYPVRIMTYDLNSGFNTKGKLDIEEIAKVIEGTNSDIVALQEVSRGSVANGRLDMLAWLSQRLRMPYVFEPTSGKFWGNAILSRYPILAFSRENLPPPDVSMPSGLLAALIDLGNGQTIKVITTEFNHTEKNADVGQSQAKAVLDFWAGTNVTVILGNLNAQPDAPEIDAFNHAGLRDAAGKENKDRAYTYMSDDTPQRLDYIWMSPDLSLSSIQVQSSKASAHFPVVAFIDRSQFPLNLPYVPAK